MNFVELQKIIDSKYDVYVVGSGIAAVSLIASVLYPNKLLKSFREA